MNSVYAGWHVDALLDRFNEVSKENDGFRQLLIKSLKIISAPEHFALLDDQRKSWGLEIQEALQP